MIMNMIIKHNKNLYDTVKRALHEFFPAIFNDCHSFSFSIKANDIFIIYKNCKLHQILIMKVNVKK